jgi:chromosome segregation ATPase
MDEQKAEKKRIANKASRLANAKAKLEEAESALAKMPPPNHNSSEAEDIKIRQRDLERERVSVQDGISEVDRELEAQKKHLEAAKAKLRELDSARGQRLEALASKPGKIGANIRQADADVAHAAQQGRFRAKVFGPLACEVADITGKDAGAMLEQQCEAYLWTAFMAQNREDQEVLQSLLLSRGIAVLCFTGATDRTFARPVEAEAVRDLGVVGTLDAQFSAPDAVKGVLCDMGGLAKAYVATVEGDRHADTLLQRRGLGTLWTPTNQYVCSKSRHSNATSMRMVPKRDARIFTQRGISPAAKQELQTQIADIEAAVQTLKARKLKLDEELREKTTTLNNTARRREELEKQKRALEKERVKLTNTVASRRLALAVEEEESDSAAVLEKHQKACDTARRRLVAHALKCGGLHASMAELAAERAASLLSAAEAKEQARVLAAQSEGHSGAVKQARELRSSLEALYKRDKEQALKLHSEAKAAVPLTAEREAAFEDMPSKLDELQARIDAAVEEADAILCPNPSVMQNYLRINSELGQLEKTHGEKAATLSDKQAVIDATKNAWLPRLRQLFGRINTAFSAAFTAIGCAGEVRLCEAPGDDFASYAVDILVKFRAEEQLQKLTANRQSGGERSVSTMLYLISLQDLTRCPFRVVDEINQGMDPKNERKIFRQMVASACAPGTPQCFLLTPKLLPQLDYSPEVTVLAIFNGPWIKQVSTGFDSDKFLGRKRAAE